MWFAPIGIHYKKEYTYYNNLFKPKEEDSPENPMKLREISHRMAGINENRWK